MTKQEMRQYLEQEAIAAETKARWRAERAEARTQELDLLENELRAAAQEIEQSGAELDPGKVVRALSAYFNGHEVFGQRISSIRTVRRVESTRPITLDSCEICVVVTLGDLDSTYAILVGPRPSPLR